MIFAPKKPSLVFFVMGPLPFCVFLGALDVVPAGSKHNTLYTICTIANGASPTDRLLTGSATREGKREYKVESIRPRWTWVAMRAKSVGRTSTGDEAFVDWPVAAISDSDIVMGSMRGIAIFGWTRCVVFFD